MKKPTLVIFILLISITVFGIWYSGILNAKNIKFNIGNAVCINSQELESYLNLRGQNLFLINKKVLLVKIQQRYPCVNNMEIEYSFPSGLAISFFNRNPIARVTAYDVKFPLSLNLSEASPSSEAALIDWSIPKSGENAFLIDSDGYIFSSEENYELPLIYVPDQELFVPKQMDKNIFNKISIILSKFSTATTLKLSEINIQIIAQQKAIFSLGKDILPQLASLQLINEKAKIEGKVLESVDLRFDKPIVVYVPK